MPFHPLRPLMRPNFWPASPFPDTTAENLRNAHSKWQLIHSGDTFFFTLQTWRLSAPNDCGSATLTMWSLTVVQTERLEHLPKRFPNRPLGQFCLNENWKFSGQRLRWPDNNTGTLGLLSLVLCLYLLRMCFIKHLFSCLGTPDNFNPIIRRWVDHWSLLMLTLL